MKKPVLKSLIMVSQIGISMMVPIFLCAFIGIQLDKWLGTGFLVLIMLLIGFITAFRNVYHLTKRFYSEDKKKEDARLKYFEDMRKERESKAK